MQHEGGHPVNDETQRGSPDDDARPHRFGVPQPVDAFDDDQRCHDSDQRGVGERSQDGGSMVAERARGTGRPECQAHSHEGEDQGAYVGEVVPGIGQEPARVGDGPSHRQGDDQQRIEGETDCEATRPVHGLLRPSAYP
jgi:hypothetical protein